MPTLRAWRGVLVLATAAYAVSVLPGVRPAPGYSRLWEVVVYNLVAIGATSLCVRRAVLSTSDRVPWALFSLGLASYAAGTLLFSLWLQPMAQMPYPSASDGLWLLFYPFSLAGLVLAVRARTLGSAATMWLDGLIAGVGLASVAAVLVFDEVAAGATGPTAAIVVNLAYPVSDLALATMTVGAMAVLGGWRNPTWLLLAGGFVTFAAADSWYVTQVAADTYRAGSPVDAVWAVAMCLVGIAASTASTRSEFQAGSRSFLLPGVFAMASIAVLGVGTFTHVPRLGSLLAVVALVAAFARTWMAVRDVVALADSGRQARTDLLTGLANRRAFEELLEEPGGVGTGGALLLIDLDRFKEVNDALGHRTGDELLRAVGDRLAARLGPADVLFRLGGDEFAIVVPNSDVTAATALADAVLTRMQKPFEVAGMTLHCDVSIGVTAVRAGRTSRALARADLAMYRAKASRAGFEVYSDERDGDAWNRLALVEELREALAGGGLHLELQPIIALPSRTPVAVEALVRWTHPVHGRLAPDEFLPMAERAGLMWTVTKYVLDRALDEADALRSAGWSLPVAVNLSASDLLNSSLVDFVAAGLSRRGLPGAALHLEITESLLVEDRGISSPILLGLRALGVQISVDDFGTGYSCLAYLRDLPVHEMKIDRSFTGQILDDVRTATIVASTITLAHDLGLSVVAEGVETAEQLEWLDEHGCDKVQGYHLSRPQAPPQLHEWLAGSPTADRTESAAPAREVG